VDKLASVITAAPRENSKTRARPIRFLHNGHFANAGFGGWTLAGITTLQRGKPLALTTATNNTNSLGGGSRPNNNGHSAQLEGAERTLTRCFNTSVFSQPDPFTFGSTGRLSQRLGVWPGIVLRGSPPLERTA